MHRELTQRYRPPTVRAVLLLALCVPMVVVAAATYRRTSDLGVRVSESEEVVAVAETLEDLVRLRTSLSVEQRWTSVVETMDELGFPPSLAQLAIGVNPTSEAESAARSVDTLLGVLGDSQQINILATTRAGVGKLDTYDTLVAEISARIARELSSAGIRTGVIEIQVTGSLADRAAQWQLAYADQLWGWMGVTAGFTGGETNPAQLLLDSSVRERLLSSSVELSLTSGSLTSTAWNDAAGSDALRQLAAVYASRLDEVVDGSATAELELSAIVDNLDEFTAVTQLAAVGDDYALRVVEAALHDLRNAAASERSDALASRNLTLLVAAGVLGLLMLVVLAITRMIIRPMAQVAVVAGAMKRGSLDTRADVNGPRETRLAAEALNEAVEQMKLAERQALALAEERLDDPVLKASVPGLLGASLRRAVSQLHRRLTDADMFRRRLEHQATHDPLTQLPNRRATLEHLAQAVARADRGSHEVAVVYIDIDFFKNVNDRHGHAAGDDMLIHVAQVLSDSSRAGDHVGRLGGDEFLLIAEPVATTDDVVALGERILGLISMPLTLGDVVLHPSVSMGIAISGDGVSSADQLVRATDLALYRAKDMGRGGFEVCDDSLRALLTSRAEISEALEIAIDNDQLCLYYQPLVDAPSRRVVGAEALVRWNREGIGVVMPDEFIPVAERGDLILRLDRWVLNEAARQLRVWATLDETRDLDVAVNVSGRHLSSSSFVADVLGPLTFHGVEPSRLVIEITESALVDDLEQAAARLHRLKDAGVRVALDDFGTGFASLAHLRSLPIDVLKIDRSFVGDLDSGLAHPFVSLVLDTGRLLGVQVVGEGVETVGQAEVLDNLGCDLLQGFLFGRPQPASAFEESVRELPGADRWINERVR